MNGQWITDWDLLVATEKYIVCPIQSRADDSLYLGKPLGVLLGWQVLRLMRGGYAALPCPPFNPEAPP